MLVEDLRERVLFRRRRATETPDQRFCRIMAGLAPAIPFSAAGKGGPGCGPWATRMDIPT